MSILLRFDQPTKDRFILHLQAAFAEEEGRRISLRTKEALAAAKRRGVEIGATGRARAARLKREAIQQALQYKETVETLKMQGFITLRTLRDEFDRRGVPSPGGGKWHLPNVHRLCRRLEAAEDCPPEGRD